MDIPDPVAQEFQRKQSVGLLCVFRRKDLAIIQDSAEDALIRLGQLSEVRPCELRARLIVCSEARFRG